MLYAQFLSLANDDRIQKDEKVFQIELAGLDMSQANIIIESYCLLITITLQVCNVIANHRTEYNLKNRLLGVMGFVNALIILSYIAYILVDGKPEYSLWNNIFVGVCYAGGAVLTELFGEYAFAIVQEKKDRGIWLRPVIRAICTAAVILDFLSIFNGSYFSTMNGFHVRGPYYVLNQIFMLCIILIVIIYIAIESKEMKKNVIALIMYGFFPALSTILQIFVQDYVLLYPAITLSLLIIYVVSYLEQSEELHQKNDELQKAMAETELAKKAAEHANASKSDFLSSMSHDIRTPLNAIIGMTDIAIENIDDQKQAVQNLNVVKTSSKHLLSLVNDVLDLSMIESGKMTISETEFILPDLLSETMRIIWPLASAKKQDLSLETEGIQDEFYLGDMPRMHQILVNILSNAVKYTPSEGKIVLKVEEKRAEDGHSAVLTISCTDNGIGIAKEYQDQIFEPFVREVKTTVNPIEGTGLGLAIVNDIVKAMHGTVKVISEKGMGSAFILAIPLGLADEEKMLQRFADVKDLSLLVVCDEPADCSIVCLSEKDGAYPYDICSSADILSGMQKTEKQYDAVLCRSMYRQTETIHVLRDLYPASSLIFNCKASDINEERKYLDAGADMVMYGPIFRTSLYEEFETMILKKKIGVNHDEYLKGKNVMIVEDQAINYLIVEHMMKNAGASVWKAENGMEAVDLFLGSAVGQFDLIMMDIMMPVMDGYAAASKIRSARRTDAKTVPMIAMTANAFEEDIQRSKSYGMNAHLSKPLDPQMVKETVLHLLKH
jgi:signal transduction histidine kinase/CheY-like chemotaxis protein